MKSRSVIPEALQEKAEINRTNGNELLKIKAMDESASEKPITVAYLGSLLFLFMFLIIMNLGVVLLLGDLFDKTYCRLLCVGGFFGVLWQCYALNHRYLDSKSPNGTKIKQALN